MGCGMELVFLCDMQLSQLARLVLCANCAQAIVYYYTVYSMLAQGGIALILLSVVAQLLVWNCGGKSRGDSRPLSLAGNAPAPLP